MAITKKQIRKILEREFIAGTVYRVDMDRVDVLPSGSVGALHSLPLTGDRDKVKPGDPVKIITVAGERVALAEDIASASSGVEAVSALTEDQQTLLAKIGGGGTVSAPTPGTVSEASYYVSDWRVLEGAVYASATKITLPKDVTSRIPKGAKVRVVQSGTDKYFYCVGTSYSAETLLTTLTLAGGQDYSVANAAIEEFAYSTVQSPQGFPEWFVFACTWTASGSNPSVGNATGRAYFKIDGTLLTWVQYIFMGTTTTYGSGSWRFSLPVPAYSDGNIVCFFSMAKARDATGGTYPLMIQLNDAATYLTYFLTTASPSGSTTLTSTTPFTWAVNDELGWTVQYRI